MISKLDCGGAASGSKPVSGKSISEIAREVIAGQWGNGADRASRLTAAGYDAAAIQKIVNAKLLR